MKKVTLYLLLAMGFCRGAYAEVEPANLLRNTAQNSSSAIKTIDNSVDILMKDHLMINMSGDLDANINAAQNNLKTEFDNVMKKINRYRETLNLSAK